LREYPEGMSRQPAQPDDDALSWAGDDDPTLDVGERRVDERAEPPQPVEPTDRPSVAGDSSATPTDAGAARAASDDPRASGVSVGDVDEVSAWEVAPARSETAHARADADADVDAVAGTGSATGAATASPAEAPREQMSSVALIAVSVLGGIFLLYTIGWFVSVQRIGTGASDGLRTLMFTVGQVLAVAAAPLWFAASFFATRGRQARWFVLALIVGAFVLIPWPFVIGAR
jgi:hypothetical protein